MKTLFPWLTKASGGPVESAALHSSREMRIEYYRKQVAAAAEFQRHCFDGWHSDAPLEVVIIREGKAVAAFIPMDDAGKAIMQDVFCYAFHRQMEFQEKMRVEVEAYQAALTDK